MRKETGGVCTNTGHYSVQRLERGFIEKGLGFFTQYSDFASADQQADTIAGRLEAAELAVAEAKQAILNVKTMMLSAICWPCGRW